jgi:hypothetical protein
MPDKPEDTLKRRGHYHPMPRPYTNENVIEAMQEYSSLVLQECIKEMESYKKSMFPNPDILFQREIGQDDMISILKKRIEGNK